MDNAKVEKYAKWLVQNKDKKGTPEFDTVVKAYKQLRSEVPSATDTDTGPAPSWSEVPAQALQNAPASARKLAGNVLDGVKEFVQHPISTTEAGLRTLNGLALNIPGAEALNKAASDIGIAPITPGGAQSNAEDKAAGAEIISTKAKEYGTSEGFRNKLAKDPFSIVGDAATIASPELAARGIGVATKVAKSAKAKAIALNKVEVAFPDVAGDVAADIKRLHDAGEHDFSDVSTSTERGAKGGMSKLFTDNKTEMDANYQAVKHLLDPNEEGISAAQRLERLEAQKALASGDHLVMDHSTKAQIAAVDRLVGNTAEGAALVKGLKKQVEITRLRNKVQGGISQYTDQLNPLEVGGGGRFGPKGIPAAVLAGAGVATMNPLIPAAQAGVVLGGRVIDAITGSRSLPKKFMKQNLDKGTSDPTQGLLSEVQRRAEVRQTAKETAEAMAQSEADIRARENYMRDAAERENKAFDKAQKVRQVQAAKAMAAYHKDMDRKVSEIAKAQKTKAAEEVKAQTNAAKELATKEAATQRQAAKEAAALEKQKKQDEANAKKEAEKKAKEEAKAAEKQKKQEVQGPLDEYGKPIRNQKAYEERKAKIKADQANAAAIAERTKTPHVRKAIELALKQMTSDSGRGRKNQMNRLKFYYDALGKAKSKHDRARINDALKPLVEAFMRGEAMK